MEQVKRILCAVDLSDFGERAIRYTVMMAKSFDAEIVVLYVSPTAAQYAAFGIQPKALETFLDGLSSGAGKLMKALMSAYFSDVKARERIEKGDPAGEILKAAKDSGADLIIMGTRGRKGMDLLLSGSVAETVVRSSKIPVLTVQPD